MQSNWTSEHIRKPASWVIVDRVTAEPVCELFTESLVNKLSPAYRAVPILEYLAALNLQSRLDTRP